jgi:hypothetical protein
MTGPNGTYTRIASNYTWNDTTYIDPQANPTTRLTAMG